MFGAPTATAYDLRFSIAGIPVRIHPLFWLVSIILGFRPGDPLGILLWVVAVFVSILIHELGHAFTMRYYGYRPAVVLYAGGGLAMYHGDTSSMWSNFGSGQRRGRDGPWSRIIVAAAGPAAGFLVAAIIFGYLVASNSSVWLLGEKIGFGPSLEGTIEKLVHDLIYINFFWGAVNLLPIFPLDGGQISRELFEMHSRDGLRQSLWLSIIAAGGMALLGFTYLEENFVGFLFLYFAFVNWQMLQTFTGRGGYGGGPW